MCGIYGAFVQPTNKKNATELVFEGIKRIEYRGYDSWGVAALDAQSEIQVFKQTGKISSVEALDLPASRAAIGHTRWATHGRVTDTNAHPHLASDGSFVLVHNGVVENYQELKKELQADGYTFQTETDTEVIVGLVERENGRIGEQVNGKMGKRDKRKKGELENGLAEAVKAAVARLDGRSTVLVMDQQGDMVAFRYGSPLVVGRSPDGDLFFSSDVLTMSVDADEFVSIDQGQLVSWVDGQLEIQDLKTGQSLDLNWQPIAVQAVSLDKEGYDHFMLKEIMEQGRVLHQVAEQNEAQLEELLQVLRQARTIYTLGAGSASYAAGQLAFYLRQVGLPAVELKSYEAKSYRSRFSKKDICIALSQSGETADTNEVIEWMQEAGVTIASLVNMPGSTLTQMSDFAFMLQVGPEVGVASTKALTGKIVWSKLLALLLEGRYLVDIKQEILAYEHALRAWLENDDHLQQLQQLAKKLADKPHLFVLGRGQLYYPALEFALKIKEISYIHAEGFSGGELKHGVIALIESGTPVICLIADDDEQPAMINAAAEVKARGAQVIGIAQQPNELFDEYIEILPNQRVAVSSIVPAQLLTYYLALEKGLDPDKPRNLAKSVTVK